MNAPDGIRFRSKDERTLPLYALMNKAINDYIKAITHICENDALDKCADILELHGWTKQRTCHNLKAEWPSLFECDKCGYDNSDTYYGSEWRFKFCPNCGAKVVR